MRNENYEYNENKTGVRELCYQNNKYSEPELYKINIRWNYIN